MAEKEKSPGWQCRQLVRGLDRASLATLMPESAVPYASLVMCALDLQGRPILLLSDLADHTKNLSQNANASLLFDATAGLAEPLTGARVTLMGHFERLENETQTVRFLRRHPSAKMYAAFKDFNFYRFMPEKAHLVAGFGKIHWTAQDLILPLDNNELETSEGDILSHMNADHSDAIALYANRLLNLPRVGWTLTGVDPEGADLRRGGAVARLQFEKQAFTAEQVRVELVRLVKKARAKGA